MAYLGQAPFQEFTNPPTKDDFTGDGSTTTFDLASEVPSGAQNALEVYVDNVRQEPGSGKAFSLGVDGSGDTKRITFTAAPANGAAIYVINDKTNTSSTAPLQNDLNGTELILDADGDTTITADTDDRIDFKIGNIEHFSLSSNSGDTIIKPMTDGQDIKFQQYDGRTLLEINDTGYVAIANGTAGPGELRLYEDNDNGVNYSAFQAGTQSGNITYTLPTADGSSGEHLTTNGSGTLTWSAAAAANPTSADGDTLGTTSLEWSDLYLADGSQILFGNDQEVTLTHVHNAGLLLNSTMQLQFNDASQYINAPSATVLDINATDEIELNATLVDINANVEISGTTTIAGNLVFGSATVTEAQLEILDGATVTTDELNIIDGGTSASSVTVADADRVVFNDGGTMKQVAVTDLAAYFDDEITSMPNLTTAAALVTVSALDTGSITSGFGNIDNGASNITSGGLVKLDVDADADDVTGDSATGRLTLGAGEDLNLYHGGTNSYIVNDTGDLILKTGASDEDMIFQGNDGGSAITALTLDMSAAGKATFNDGIVATTGTFSGVVDADAGITVDNITIDGTEIDLSSGNLTIDVAGNITIDADGGTITFADAGSSLGTITSSGYSGTSAVATVATTVTVTDNENTNENNVLTFVAGADADGGNVGLESDGNLTYNPSTGTLSATNLVVSGTQTVTNSVVMNANNAVVFEGATADAHETTLTSVDATGDRTISLPNVSGTLPVLAAASATAITTTPAELNLIDGGTSRGTDAVASGDGILINDGGTMKMTNVDTVSTYFASHTVGGGNIVTTGALDSGSITSGFGAIDNGTSNIRSATITAETAFVPDAADGATLGTSSLEFSDLFLADASTIQFGADQDVTLTHVADTGLLLNSTMQLQFNDASQNINAPSATVLDINATDEIELNATLVDINANVEISGTATTTGVHTFTAVPVFPDNTIETADIQADAITGAKIADNAINSEHYTDGSIDTAHIADAQVTNAKLSSSMGDCSAKGFTSIGLDGGDYIGWSNNAHVGFVVNGNEEFRMEADGDFHADGDVIAYSTTISDERLKENIQPIGDALSKVSQLNGVTFTYKPDGKESAGLIAQDVEKVLPSAITEKELPLKQDDGEKYKVLQYDQTIGLLVEAIKELTAKVEELEKK
jgi:hypothetical protein